MLLEFKLALKDFKENKNEQVITDFLNNLPIDAPKVYKKYLKFILKKNKNLTRLRKELKSYRKKIGDVTQLINDEENELSKLVSGHENLYEGIDTFYSVNIISKYIEERTYKNSDTFFDTREKAEEFVTFLEKISVIGTKLIMVNTGNFNDGYYDDSAKLFYGKNDKNFYNFDKEKIWTVKGYGYFDYINTRPLLEREAIEYDADTKITEWILPAINKYNFKSIKFLDDNFG